MSSDFERSDELLPLPAVLRPAIGDARRSLAAYGSDLERALSDIEGITERGQARRVWLDALAGLGSSTERTRKSLNRISAAAGLPRGAKGRLLAYFQLHLGEPLSGLTLGAVAGIGEWARRIRELRAEGYQIGSDETRDDLNAGEYVLLSPEADTRVRDQWTRAEAVRKMHISARERTMLFLRDHVGQTLTEDQLRHASRARNVRGLLRQLRQSEAGLQTNLDTPELSKGEYRLKQ